MSLYGFVPSCFIIGKDLNVTPYKKLVDLLSSPAAKPSDILCISDFFSESTDESIAKLGRAFLSVNPRFFAEAGIEDPTMCQKILQKLTGSFFKSITTINDLRDDPITGCPELEKLACRSIAAIAQSIHSIKTLDTATDLLASIAAIEENLSMLSSVVDDCTKFKFPPTTDKNLVYRAAFDRNIRPAIDCMRDITAISQYVLRLMRSTDLSPWVASVSAVVVQSSLRMCITDTACYEDLPKELSGVTPIEDDR